MRTLLRSQLWDQFCIVDRALRSHLVSVRGLFYWYARLNFSAAEARCPTCGHDFIEGGEAGE